MQTRYMQMKDVTTRTDEDGNIFLEGMFAVYGSVYNVYPGATESIARGAFADSIGGDVRALYNHNTGLVLGRTSAGTLDGRDERLCADSARRHHGMQFRLRHPGGRRGDGGQR